MSSRNRPDGVAERRGSRRFSIEQELTYKVLGAKTRLPQTGTGKTINFSSRGLLIRNDGPALCAGALLEISVNWPALLSGTCPLKFVASGRVLRVDENGVAFKIEQYDFRTRRLTEGPRPLATGLPFRGEAHP